MTTRIEPSSDQQLPLVNPTQSTSAIYKTIMELRAAHAPIEDEEDHRLETLPTRAAAYARANSFAKPEFKI
jgi:hypothetical protein